MGRPALSSGWSLEVAGNRHPREMATVRFGLPTGRQADTELGL